MTQDHSFLPPSGASTWVKCAKWATMNRQYPQETSAEADEGTAAHWVATELIAGRVHPEGTQTPNNLIVTDEMIEGATLVAETVALQMKGLNLHVEEQVSIAAIHSDCFGTPDIWANTGVSKHVKIVDYKFGHRFVDEYFNWQGLTYLAGILEQIYGQIDSLDPQIEVSFTVVQPRCFYKGVPVRTHTFKLWEASPYMRQLRDAALAACNPDPEATTNEGCGYCPGRHACPALQLAAYSDAEFATDRIALELSPEAMGLELRLLQRALERLAARVDGLKEQTLATIKAGKRVPYFHVESGSGRVQWNMPEGQIIAMGQICGKDLSKPGVITPAQARKLGIDESVIKAYSFTPATGLKLVADNPTDARKVFST